MNVQITKRQMERKFNALGILRKQWTFDMYGSGLIDYRVDLAGPKYATLSVDSDDFFDMHETGMQLLNKDSTRYVCLVIHNDDNFMEMEVYSYASEIVEFEFEEICLN